MELSMFKNRTFSVTNGVAMVLAFAMMGVFFMLPMFLEAVLGYGYVKAGLTMLPLAAVVIVASPLSGTLSDRVGPKWLMFAGMVMASVGFFLTRGAMVVGASWQSLILPFAVSGFGIGMVMPPSTSAVMGSVVPEKAGQASGVLSTVRQVGSVLGIAVMGALLQNRAAVYIQASISAKLDAAPFPLTAEVKQQILTSVANVDMGQLRAGGGLSGAMPDSVTSALAQMPASVAEQVKTFFKDVFNMDAIMSDYVHAMRTTYLFSIILVGVGAILALTVTARKAKPVVASTPAGECGDE
jgi:MFS family permease